MPLCNIDKLLAKVARVNNTTASSCNHATKVSGLSPAISFMLIVANARPARENNLFF
jgi:pyrroline-5-carboxylate reductase